MDELKTTWKGTAPWIEMDTSEIQGTGKGIYEGFINYANALNKVVQVELPELLEFAEKLPTKADEARESSKSEFDGLGAMAKAKALMAFGFNVRIIGRIPSLVKETANA